MSPNNIHNAIDWTVVRALSFDIYGTLIEWRDGIIDAALSTSLGPNLPSDRSVLYEQLRSYDRVIEKEQPALKKSEVNAEALRRFAADLRLVDEGSVRAEDVESAAREYGGAIGRFPAFGDTVRCHSQALSLHSGTFLIICQIDAITRLSKHFSLIPLSNIDHASFRQTLSGPLKDITFTTSYIAEDIGSYKPNLANFEYLLSHLRSDLGVEKEQLVHVAQSLYHDHAPCKEARIRSVWVDRYGVLSESGGEWKLREEYGFALRVESLGQLADLVDEAFELKTLE